MYASIDLQKAFDTLDHQMLIHKEQKYEYRGPILVIMKSYLKSTIDLSEDV